MGGIVGAATGVTEKLFGALTGGGKQKAPEPVGPKEPPPSVDTEGVRAAGDAQRRRERMARGKASTMLTGSQGVTSTDTAVGTKKLLGQ